MRLPETVRHISDNASRSDRDVVDDDQQVSGEIMGALQMGEHVSRIDVTDSMIVKTRFIGTTIADSAFVRVIFLGCDFSGLLFSNCLLRDCFVVDVRSRSVLGFDNCILDNLSLIRTDTDRMEIHGSDIGALNCTSLRSEQLIFQGCKPYQRTGEVLFEQCDFKGIGGLAELGRQGVQVRVDPAMWRDLGDLLVREQGIAALGESQEASASLPSADVFDTLDRLANDARQSQD